MANLEQILQNFGLTEKEVKVYLACLELGSATVLNIAHKAGLHRPHVYNILESLKEKGLVTYLEKAGKGYYTPESPEKLLMTLKEKEKEIETVLPELKSIYNVPPIKPKVMLYEGREGIKTILFDSLKPEYKEILCTATQAQWDLITPTLLNEYIEKVIELRLKLRVLRSGTYYSLPELKTKGYKYFEPTSGLLREVRYTPPALTFRNIMLIYDNRVGMISSAKENLGFIIESKEYAHMMRIFYKSLWELSEPWKKTIA